MDWRQKANYLAKRVREKGGLWVIWLNGQAVDDPAQLGSTTDPDELRDPAYLELGYYEDRDGKFTADNLLLDIEDALGHPPSGAALGPQAEPASTGGEPPPEPAPAEPEDPPAEPEGEAEKERPVPDPGGRPAAEDPVPGPAALQLSAGRNPEVRPDPDSAPPEPEHEEATVPDEKTEPDQEESGYSESTLHTIRTRLFEEYSKAHNHGPREARGAWKQLIDFFEDEVAG